MLQLWAEIKTGAEPTSLTREKQAHRRDRLNHAVFEPSLMELAGRAAEHLSGTHLLSCLEVCHRLEQCTPLLLLHLVIRKGTRNRLDSGLQQTYGDHTRMLAQAIDRMAAGDITWLESRVWPGAALTQATLAQCVDDLLALELDSLQQLALWVGASLHDYGKLYGRRNGLDPEDGVALVKHLLLEAAPISHALPLILFAVRNHDIIESVTTGETAPRFIRQQVQELPEALQLLALPVLGIIQLAGAASLGTGRIVPMKVDIFRACLDGSIAAETSAEDRARTLCSFADRGVHNFATLVQDERDPAIPTRRLEYLLDHVVLQGWDDLRDDAWSKYGRDAFDVLNRSLEMLAIKHASAAGPVYHLVIDDSARPKLLDNSGEAYSALVAVEDQTLNGAGFLTVR